MTTEIMVAIISAGAAIISAAIAFGQTLRSGRMKTENEVVLERLRSEQTLLKAEADLAIERLRVDQSRHREAFEVAQKKTRPVQEALAGAWRDIQLAKEVIGKILAPERYDIDIAAVRLEKVLSILTESYASWGTDIPKRSQKAWHAAKGAVDAVTKMLNSSPDQHDDIGDHLREVRLSLSDYQAVLADEKQSLLTRRMEQALESL